MHLRHVSVANFRSYKEASLSLPATGLTFIVGPNNAGKSALLEALDAVANPGPWETDSHLGGDSPARVTVEFELEDQERGQLFQHAPDVASSRQKSPLLAELTLEYSQAMEDRRLIVEQARTLDEKGDSLTLASYEHSSGDNGNVRDALHLTDGLAAGSPSADWKRGGSSGTNQWHVTTRLGNQLRPLGALLERWRSSFFHFHANRLGTQRTRELQADPRLQPTGENLPETLLYLYTKGAEEFGAIRSVMQDVVPDVGVLETPAQGRQVKVAFRDPHLDALINLKDLGTGVEQLLMAAVVGESQPAGSIIVVEEPESHLHPDAQRRLLRHLIRWSSEHLVIASTHSTVFLDTRPHEAAVHLVQRREGISKISEATEHLPDVLEVMGVRLSDVLSAERILVVEGKSDAEVLREWFASEFTERHVEVIPGRRGGDAAWQAQALAEWLGEADMLERHIGFLRDRDELRPEVVADLEETGVVCVLGRRELENYFFDDSGAVATGLSEIMESAGDAEATVPSAETIEVQLREAADASFNAVVLKHVAQTLVPIRLVDRAAVRELVRQGAGMEELVDTVKGRLPSPDILDELRQQWDATVKDIEARWDTDWPVLAPGAEALRHVWRQYGQSYSKTRDGVLIAKHSSPPEDLGNLLIPFVDSLEAAEPA